MKSDKHNSSNEKNPNGQLKKEAETMKEMISPQAVQTPGDTKLRGRFSLSLISFSNLYWYLLAFLLMFHQVLKWDNKAFKDHTMFTNVRLLNQSETSCILSKMDSDLVEKFAGLYELTEVEFAVRHNSSDYFRCTGKVIMARLQLPIAHAAVMEYPGGNLLFMEVNNALFDATLNLRSNERKSNQAEFTFNTFLTLYSDKTHQTIKNWYKDTSKEDLSDEQKLSEIAKDIKMENWNKNSMYYYLKEFIKKKVRNYWLYIFISEYIKVFNSKMYIYFFVFFRCSILMPLVHFITTLLKQSKICLDLHIILSSV